METRGASDQVIHRPLVAPGGLSVAAEFVCGFAELGFASQAEAVGFL